MSLITTDMPQNEGFNVELEPDNLGKLFIRLIPVSWNTLFRIHREELQDVGDVLQRKIDEEGHLLCPRPYNVFRALALCPWMNTKVVIIGQDPYFLARGDEPSATGCCFECREGSPIERSLETIFTVLGKTVDGFEMPEHGDLTSWAMQGVLLLNASLTTTKGVANEHAGIWQWFTVRVLEYLAEQRKNVVYMLWGRFAQKLDKYIRKSDNLVLYASHPTARGKACTFRNCDHFNEANVYLAEHGRSQIDWRL